MTSETAPHGYSHTVTDSGEGGFNRSQYVSMDDAGNTYNTTTTRSDSTTTTEAGGVFRFTTVSTTSTAVSHDGRTSFSETTTTETRTDPDGTTHVNTVHTSKSCTDGDCEDNSKDPTPAGEVPADDGTAVALSDPDYDGSFLVSPATVHAVLVARNANINVISNDNGPIIMYDYQPRSLGNQWGPIALYGGDDDGGLTSPTMIHVPAATPEYDPALEFGLPPPTIPDNSTCQYCFQP